MAERDTRWWTQVGAVVLASVAMVAVATLVLTRGGDGDGELRADGIAAPTVTLPSEAGGDELQGLSGDGEALMGGDEQPDVQPTDSAAQDTTPSSTTSSTTLVVTSSSTTRPSPSTTATPDPSSTSTTAASTTAKPSSTTTTPPATDPPSTNPPASDPPAPNPPASEPPASDPPSTRPPATEPPTTTTRAPTTQAPTTQAPTTAPTGGGGDGGFEQRVIELTNARRRDAGCSDLSNNGKLHAAALGHSRDMAVNDYFSHTSQDGSSMSDRVERQGYSWRRLAENIAAGYRSPEDVVTGWMNSSGHRANILNCDLTEIGVGFYDYYWTQNFGTPG